MNLIQRIDALLPQTQCGKCGHAGCKPYAEGMAAGEPINRCPPGGDVTVIALAQLLQRPPLPLERERGEAPAQVAFIREAECIGCTKCIQACPVDAIVGAPKLMHTVIANDCTGCDLCLAPCPVDCIDLLPLGPGLPAPMTGDGQGPASQLRRQRARQRFEQRNARLQRDDARKRAERAARQAPPPAVQVTDETALKQARIAARMAQVQLDRARKAYGSSPSAAQQVLLAQLTHAVDRAQQQLAATTAPAPVAPQNNKRAKIQLAMAKAELARLQRSGASDAELAQARTAITALTLP